MLPRYDIRIPGSIAVEHLDLTAAYGARLPNVRGELKWSGGDVSYRLSGRDHRVALPPLVGFIDSSSSQPEISVYQVDDKMPLMLGARLLRMGMATVGITKQFTKCWASRGRAVSPITPSFWRWVRNYSRIRATHEFPCRA